MQEKLSKNTYFLYVKELEYLLAAVELLSNFEMNSKIREVYGAVFVEQKRERYPLLFELFENTEKEHCIEWLEFLLDYDVENFSIEDYFKYMKGFSKEEFLSRLLQVPLSEVEQAMESEKNQIAFYQKSKDVFKSYFAIEALFQKTEWVIDNFQDFVCELRTEQAEKYLDGYQREIETWKQKMKESLALGDGLTYSESLMGKTFHNRGPFESFYFMPSIFMPMKCCRWFEKNQILIFDAIRLGQQDNRLISDALKMLSDKTRYQILVLLKERKSMSGIEIAEQMKLAPSTVSHHMTHLKNSGLIHEEPAGNTKYYSINTHCMKNCIETLEKTFL